MEERDARESTARPVVPLLFAAVAVAAIVTLVITQELRQGTDLVNSVRLTDSFEPGRAGSAGEARVRFVLEEPDERARVSMVDRRGDVIAILHRGALAEGRHVFLWTGRTTEGELADAGRYLARVRLDELDRTIVLPGAIRVREPTARSGS